MELSDIKNRLALGLALGNPKESEIRVLAAGPLMLVRGLVASRIVLLDWNGDGLTVHRQCFKVEGDVPDLLEACNKADFYWHSGSYFHPHQLLEATERFTERVLDDVKLHAEMVYPVKTPAEE